MNTNAPQGIFLIWDTNKSWFTFRLTQHILPYGSIVVGFVPLQADAFALASPLWFSHTAEVPDFRQQPVFCHLGEYDAQDMELEAYLRYVWDRLTFEDGVLETSFMFSPTPAGDFAEEIYDVSERREGHFPDDLNSHPEADLVWE